MGIQPTADESKCLVNAGGVIQRAIGNNREEKVRAVKNYSKTSVTT